MHSEWREGKPARHSNAVARTTEGSRLRHGFFGCCFIRYTSKVEVCCSLGCKHRTHLKKCTCATSESSKCGTFDVHISDYYKYLISEGDIPDEQGPRSVVVADLCVWYSVRIEVSVPGKSNRMPSQYTRPSMFLSSAHL